MGSKYRKEVSHDITTAYYRLGHLGHLFHRVAGHWPMGIAQTAQVGQGGVSGEVAQLAPYRTQHVVKR